MYRCHCRPWALFAEASKQRPQTMIFVINAHNYHHSHNSKTYTLTAAAARENIQKLAKNEQEGRKEGRSMRSSLERWIKVITLGVRLHCGSSLQRQDRLTSVHKLSSSRINKKPSTTIQTSHTYIHWQQRTTTVDSYKGISNWSVASITQNT